MQGNSVLAITLPREPQQGAARARSGTGTLVPQTDADEVYCQFLGSKTVTMPVVGTRGMSHPPSAALGTMMIRGATAGHSRASRTRDRNRSGTKRFS
jgi:hypothetical protein